MPSLANHQSNEFTKMLLEGDSGSGKTGSLASLVAAGFSLRRFLLGGAPDHAHLLDLLLQLHEAVEEGLGPRRAAGHIHIHWNVFVDWPHDDRAARKNIARSLNIEIGAVSVKATTNEKLGYIGREEGAAAHAVCIIRSL